MFQRPNGVRIVQVGPDGRLLNYHGPSEQEAATRLFETSERPLSALAGRLLKTLDNDARRTQESSASRSTSGWWNGQPVEEATRNTVFTGPSITSTPQKQLHQAGDVLQPLRPSKATAANESFEVALFNQEHPTITNSQLMMREGGRSELERPPVEEEQVQKHQQEVVRGALQPQVHSAWRTHSCWADEPALQLQATESLEEARPPSPSFDVTMEEDQILSEQQPTMRPAANQGADSMMLGNFSPPSNLLSQFVSQDVEEEVDDNSGSPNVMVEIGHPKRPAALPLPVPKRKPTFSAPFKLT